MPYGTAEKKEEHPLTIGDAWAMLKGLGIGCVAWVRSQSAEGPAQPGAQSLAAEAAYRPLNRVSQCPPATHGPRW